MRRQDLTGIEFDMIRQMLSAMGESMEEYTVEQKRAAIRAFIRKIVWDGENAHIYLFHNDSDYEFPNSPANDSGSNKISPHTDGPLGEDSK